MTKPTKTVMAFAAALSLLSAEAHAAQTPPCVTEEEVSGMMAFAMPSALDGITRACRPHLAGNGYFATQGTALVSRYAARKDAAWPMARRAFVKFGSERDPKAAETFEMLPDAALQPFVEAMMSQMIGSDVKSKDCANYERLASLLDPLPPENTAALFGVILGIVGNKPGKSGPKICPAQ